MVVEILLRRDTWRTNAMHINEVCWYLIGYRLSAAGSRGTLGLSSWPQGRIDINLASVPTTHMYVCIWFSHHFRKNVVDFIIYQAVLYRVFLFSI